MQLSDFQFDLPEHLIAQVPASVRSQSRLLHLHRGEGDIAHQTFCDLPSLLRPGDLLILNDTRVIPARLLGKKTTGGQVEVFIERIRDGHYAHAFIRASKVPQPGSVILLSDGSRLTVGARLGRFFEISSEAPLHEILDKVGQVPMPPYIRRAPAPEDAERYQTIYNRHAGAVAAPTAGLHFDEATFAALSAKDIATAYVTLHVGAGTFLPVETEDVREHKMHSEWFTLSQATCDKIAATRAAGGRIIAVGTTTVRVLESVAAKGPLTETAGETDIFITPGFEFKAVDGLVTNFHLPGSTLIMLVSALAGRERILAAYQEAIENKYRFFSYGDAMLIL